MRWWAKLGLVGAQQRAFAIFLIVMVLSTVGIVGIAAVENIISQTKAKQAASAYESSARIEAQNECALLAGIQKAYCVDRIFRSARDREREEYELHANRKQATWNAATGKVSAFSLIFGSITLLALLITLRQQRALIRIGFAQVRSTRKAARDELTHARSVSRQELRPYVFVDKIVPEPITERSFRIVIWLKNFGQTPARNMEAIVTTYVTRNLHKLRKHRTRAHRIELGTAAPGACRRAMTPLSFTEVQWTAPGFDLAYGVIRVKYSYTDDTGQNGFEESFDYHTDPGSIMKDEPMFYLLTDSRIEESRRQEAKQGSFMTFLKRSHRAKAGLKKKTKPGDEDESGGEHF